MVLQLLGDERGTSGYWLRRLGQVLDNRNRGIVTWTDGSQRAPAGAPSMAVYRQYYEGKQPLPFSSDKFRAAFGDRLRGASENICGVTVDSLVERLRVRGFRMPPEDADAAQPVNQPGDAAAWRIWQANGLDAKMRQGFRTAATCGEANLLVGPNPADADLPLITVEDPLESVVLVNRGQRVVAMKRWYDAELDRMRAFLYYPDRIEKFWSVQQGSWYSAANVVTTQLAAIAQWEAQALAGDDALLEHGLGAVPMIPLASKPNLAGVGESDLAAVVPIQDMLNKLVADMIIASEYGSFRQKWAIGIDAPKDPLTGLPLPGWTASIAQMWSIGVKADFSKDADLEPKVGQFDITPLTPYLEAIKQRLQMASTISRMPPHYLLGDPGQWPSGESLTAAESGLVAKANDRIDDYSDPIEEAMRLAFRIAGDEERAAATGMETIWADPRFRSEAEHVDAVVKKRALGVPDIILLEELYSPQQIERIQAEQRRQSRQLASADPLMAETDVEILGRRVELMGLLRRTGATFESAAATAGLEGLIASGLEPVTVSEQGDYQ